MVRNTSNQRFKLFVGSRSVSDSTGRHVQAPQIRATAVASTAKEYPDFKDQVHHGRDAIDTSPVVTGDKLEHVRGEHPDFKDQFRAANNATSPFPVETSPPVKNGPAFKDQFLERIGGEAQTQSGQTAQNSSALPMAVALDPSVIRREEVEREIARQQQELTSRGKWQRGIIILATVGFLCTAALVLGSVCGSGSCGRKATPTLTNIVLDNSTVEPPTEQTADPEAVLSQEAQLRFDFINNVTFSGQKFSYPLPANGTVEEQALAWLIEDELTLSIDEGWRVAQRYALATIWFQQADSGESRLFGWLNGHECNWIGVSCFESGQVGDFRLVNVLSGGTIPNEIALLQDLLHLDLRRNKLTGSIPASLSSLKQLQALFVGDNMLSGTIPPELSEMISLRTLHMSENNLVGTIPESLSQLDLFSLSFGGNRISGTIPSSFALISRLDTLRMYDNMLTGTLPPEIGDLPMIQFNVGDNLLTGTIPNTYLKWSIVEPLGFYTNNLTGTMPWCGQDRAPFGRIFADCEEVDCPCCFACCPESTNGIPKYNYC